MTLTFKVVSSVAKLLKCNFYNCAALDSAAADAYDLS